MPMGRGRRGTGVELRVGCIRVSFTWKGKRIRETLNWAPSVANKAAAARLVRDVKAAIDAGLFDDAAYAKAFPDSARAKALLEADPAAASFGHFCDLYIEQFAGAAATRSQYMNELKRWRKRIGAQRGMDSIEHSWLAAQVGKVKFPSARMRNNSLIPLRGVFELWVRDRPRERVSPMDGIENARVQRKKPDPFDAEEAAIILADMAKHHDERVTLYFTFAFETGMRPEEQIALRWEKVDWRKKRALVDRVRTFKGGEKDTKTGEARWVDLNSVALAALEGMRKWTQLKDHEHVFENPVTGKAWHDERSQRDHYWKPTLRRVKLRARPPYATRATRATTMLMRHMNPAYCAKQLGHSKRVFWETYADWIDEADKGRERAKDEVALTREEEKAG
ncbi:MAG TPA: tyrosine-type recombinase/integrase [Ramlibacter sp.]|nr:tyrosine-type recombinase/integrase [Ramlibacter sp.]